MDGAGRIYLNDVDADPGQAEDLAATRLERVAAMGAMLAAIRGGAGAPPDGALSADIEAELSKAAAGYW
jgi:hypothetical protein